jgi:peptidoglycan-associated lipoprotein
MRRLLLLIMLGIAVPAAAQLPGLRRRAPQPPPPVMSTIDALRADFAARSGGATIYFAPGSAQLTQQARMILSAQAMWLREHPEVAARIEGHGDPTDTRDHALALGAERAAQARDYLLLLAVPSAQVSAMTWGKERPDPPSATTILQELSGPPLVPTAG